MRLAVEADSLPPATVAQQLGDGSIECLGVGPHAVEGDPDVGPIRNVGSAIRGVRLVRSAGQVVHEDGPGELPSCSCSTLV